MTLSFREYIEFAESCYSSLCEEHVETRKIRSIISCVLFSWIALESFINNMIDDWASLPKSLFSVHEQGLLLEKKVEFKREGEGAGEFQLDNRDDYKRIEDKILFLLAKKGFPTGTVRGTSLWQRFENLKNIRNNITHPRRSVSFTPAIADAETAINTVKDIITFIGKEVWRKNIEF